MKVVVIGGCGHIGSYLVPRLIREGFSVTVITRGKSRPYVSDPAWNAVEQILLDRNTESAFAEKIAGMAPDIVIDLINFYVEDTKKMVEALKRTRCSHYLFCSSIWSHGRAESLPADPNTCLKDPLDDYGIQKFQSEQYLKEEFRVNGFPSTIILPGQISGPGWLIINPYGNTNPAVFEKIARGEEIFLPNFGMETLHHVHADDVAQLFFKAILHRNQALGESFHAVAEDSLTLYGYAKAMYAFFGQKPRIQFLPWKEWCAYIDNRQETEHTYYHIARSGYYSIENAKRLLGYQPGYSTLKTVEVSIQSYLDRGVIMVP